MNENILKNFKNKKVLVMGLGRFGGGIDSAMFAARYAKEVIVTDMAVEDKLKASIGKLDGISNITFCLGKHQESDFENCDTVIVNPAINPDNNKYLKIAKDSDAFITSQIEIFFELCPAKIVAITGSNGKSTTTALTFHLLNNNPPKMQTYNNVFLSGNIGNKPLLEIIDDIKADDIVVLEISSFQLEQLARIKKSPNVALITNITPNHLDRHITFQNYIDAKEYIFKFQKAGDVAIFNGEDEEAVKLMNKVASYSPATCMTYNCSDLPLRFAEITPLPGRANFSNLAGAVAIARQLGMGNKSIKKAIETFKALPHRLECVSRKNGIRWYNDSIATTPESVMVAIEAFEQNKIIIAGGYDKGISFEKLGQKIVENKNTIKAIILIGQTTPKIAAAIPADTVKVEMAGTLEDAVKLANSIASSGDVVLLSPACASYDMFDNFQQRGEMFAEFARKI
jgi:UDP-N-acetylmuramoylalanine--D-glutamate ligase